MATLAPERGQRWDDIVRQVGREYQALPATERTWISLALVRIATLQVELDGLFCGASGEGLCADCAGACCAKGHNHATLTTLLMFLDRDVAPPAADFTRTCPWLGEQGCVLAADSRPYNCITFVCDKIEQRLTAAELHRFYQLDRELRACYQAFADRYPGAGMTGLLLRAARLEGRSFFDCRAEITSQESI